MPERTPKKGPRRSPVWWGLATAAAVLAVTLFAFFVTRPLHAKGYGQPLSGYWNGLDSLLRVPGSFVSRNLGYRGGDHQAVSLVGVFAGLPLYFLLGWLIATWRQRLANAADATPSLGRRRFLTTGPRVVGGALAAGCGYSLLVEPRWFVTTHHVFALRGLPPSLDGLRAVQLSDIHHGPWLSLAYVEEVVRAANALDADLVLLTGDYLLASRAYLRPAVETLARLRAKIGVVAVLGNHDRWEGENAAANEFARVGVPLLDNTRRVVTPDRLLVEKATEGLALAGVGDLWTDHQDYRRALGGLPAAMPRLLLTHNPDVAEEPAFRRSGLRVDLMLSGHTHGGQIWVPGLGTPVVPSAFGQKYARGFVRGPVCPVYVNRGIGMSVLPLRVGVSPELTVFELKAAEAS